MGWDNPRLQKRQQQGGSQKGEKSATSVMVVRIMEKAVAGSWPTRADLNRTGKTKQDKYDENCFSFRLKNCKQQRYRPGVQNSLIFLALSYAHDQARNEASRYGDIALTNRERNQF